MTTYGVSMIYCKRLRRNLMRRHGPRVNTMSQEPREICHNPLRNDLRWDRVSVELWLLRFACTKFQHFVPLPAYVLWREIHSKLCIIVFVLEVCGVSTDHDGDVVFCVPASVPSTRGRGWILRNPFGDASWPCRGSQGRALGHNLNHSTIVGVYFCVMKYIRALPKAVSIYWLDR